MLPVPAFNLALSKLHWDSGEEAILGNLDGKNLGLFVGKPGEFFFDWSLRGTALPGGLQFDLHLPPCPVGMLELKLPANHQVLVPRGAVLLSGPDIAEQPGKCIWLLHFGGRSEVEFQVRRPSETQQPLILCQLQAKQQVTPQAAGGGL